jgi:hypothetical protein
MALLYHPSTNLFLQQPRQLVATVVNPLAVRRINHPDERICLLKVVLPVCPQCLLPANIPYAVSMCLATRQPVQYRCSACSFHGQSLIAIHVTSTYPSYSIVLMIKPRVGLTLFTSSFMIFFTMVVFPALSNPLLQSA